MVGIYHTPIYLSIVYERKKSCYHVSTYFMAPHFKPYTPNISVRSLFDIVSGYHLVDTITGWVFALGIAAFIVSLILSGILFALSGGRLTMVERSRLWLVSGATCLLIGGIIWAIFRVVAGIIAPS